MTPFFFVDCRRPVEERIIRMFHISSGCLWQFLEPYGIRFKILNDPLFTSAHAAGN